MSEVLEIIEKAGFLLGLFYFAWKDYKTNLVSVYSLLGFAVFGLAVKVLGGNFLPGEILSGVLVGGVCLLISIITAEGLGFGDSLFFCGTGVFLDGRCNLLLLCGTLLLAGGMSCVCLCLKKKGRKDRIPLIPFVFTAYVLFLL